MSGKDTRFKVGDKLRNIRASYLPVATVTQITERGFKYELERPFVISPRLGTQIGGESYDDSQWANVETVSNDTQVKQEARWDKSGLKEASQRALKLGRTHQETDIQLFLDMLLEIERLEDALATVRREVFKEAIETVKAHSLADHALPRSFKWSVIAALEASASKKGEMNG